jgi:hypothetical protein
MNTMSKAIQTRKFTFLSVFFFIQVVSSDSLTAQQLDTKPHSAVAKITLPCVQELDSAIALVTRNYAGYTDKLARLGKEYVHHAIEQAKQQAQAASTPAECDQILWHWLSSFKDHHLNLKRAAAPVVQETQAEMKQVSFEPSTAALSDSTFLIRVPSFDISWKAVLEGLLTRSDAEIRRRPNLIIDVRNNGGGADATFSPLIPYLYTKPIQEEGVEVLASPDNITKWEQYISMVPESEKEVRKQIESIVSVMRAHISEFVTIVSSSQTTLPTVLPFPKRVAVLMNEECTSSCEQFLLAARQSDKVTLFGRPSKGVLDYSNVVEYELPSKVRSIGIPTTRSNRLPKNPVDGIGIQPDVSIEPESFKGNRQDSELDYVLRYIEQRK